MSPTSDLPSKSPSSAVADGVGVALAVAAALVLVVACVAFVAFDFWQAALTAIQANTSAPQRALAKVTFHIIVFSFSSDDVVDDAPGDVGESEAATVVNVREFRVVHA